MPLEIEIDTASLKLLESGQGAVLMANHSSYLDINVAFASCPIPIVFLGKASLRKVPLIGGASNASGLDAQRAIREGLKLASRLALELVG